MESNGTVQEVKKRRVAKKAGVAVCWFFAAMLVLTYLSRAVSKALMAKVGVGYMTAAVLDESVSGTGTWTAGEARLYTTYYTRRITEVYVRPGDTVAVGDPLFAYDVATVKGGKDVSDKTVRAARRAVELAEAALADAAEPAYAESVLASSQQALAYAEFTYAQTYALQNGGVVRATFSGLVVQCDLAVGKASTAGSTGIAVAPGGAVFTLSVPEKDAKRIAPGDAVTLYTNGKEEPEPLLVDAVGAPDADGNVPITCAGDGGKQRLVNARQDWEIKKQSARYQQTVPIAALRQSGGDAYYVLLLTEKETILGTQLVATEQAVTLLAHDSKRAAVEGGVSEQDKLITESTKELVDGDYVVLRDAD